MAEKNGPAEAMSRCQAVIILATDSSRSDPQWNLEPMNLTKRRRMQTVPCALYKLKERRKRFQRIWVELTWLWLVPSSPGQGGRSSNQCSCRRRAPRACLGPNHPESRTARQLTGL